MIDWHCHILPGIDDGPETIAESVVMAKHLAEFGYKQVCCTPHCMRGVYEYSSAEVKKAVKSLQKNLNDMEVNLKVLPGMEYYLDDCFLLYLDDLLPLGDTRLVLVEAPPQAHPNVVEGCLAAILSRGFKPLIAHPERSDFFINWGEEGFDAGRLGLVGEKPNFFKRIFGRKKENSSSIIVHSTPSSENSPPGDEAVNPKPKTKNSQPAPNPAIITPQSMVTLREDCLYQANLGSFTGYYGEKIQHRAYAMLTAGKFDCLASDGHDRKGLSKILIDGISKLSSNPALSKLLDFYPHITEETGSDQLNLF